MSTFEPRPSNESTAEEHARLQLLFRRASSLPQLPQTALRLIQLIDEGESGARQLEQVILEDPGLAAELLRHASLSAHDREPPVSIRQVIMRLGQNTVRSISSSMLVSLAIRRGEIVGPFNPRRSAMRSTATAIIARFLYARAKQSKPFESAWSADDLYAAGLLLSLPVALLAKVAHEVFRRTFHSALRTQTSVESAYRALYGESLFQLGADAASSWNMASVFTTALRCFEEPSSFEQEYVPLCCLNYANQIVVGSDTGLEPWPVARTISPEVEEEVGMQDEEIAALLQSVQAHLRVSGYVDSQSPSP
ncbi:MAG: HDOD domain-containing protein [Fimbriimonadaceae bacterium]|nr:HDOD domain-containing protein [Chthonomonadaceae bacterium]MCO5297114.1 HDOD domain-containing protein [Fimbriimonadaceae bacterium]